MSNAEPSRKPATLRNLLDAIHESVDISTAEDIKESCRLIIAAQELSGAAVDTLNACFKSGPLLDGDVPSKQGRDELLHHDFVAKVVMNGAQGFNACTYRGYWAVAIRRAMLGEEN